MLSKFLAFENWFVSVASPWILIYTVRQEEPL